jgi:DNA replicative helicase MCM subunit Mcm2 (Cdc46/Mcm family)
MKYMVIHGTVMRAQTLKNRETKKDFACKSCGKIYTAHSDLYEYSRFILPPICGGQVEKRANPFMSYIQNMKKFKKRQNQ